MLYHEIVQVIVIVIVVRGASLRLGRLLELEIERSGVYIDIIVPTYVDIVVEQ